eukprot:m.90063 g.90063  ORF g.90063 m.90063 type:complete len:120 (-) comp8440_c0_seq3:1284-1643(-)
MEALHAGGEVALDFAHLLFGDDSVPLAVTGLRKLTRILGTLCTSTDERSISQLRHIKTYQQSTMGEERLSDLTCTTICAHFVFKMNEIIDKFAKKKRYSSFMADAPSPTDLAPSACRAG